MAEASAGAWLIVRNGAERGRRYRVPADRVTGVGRSPENDVQVASEEVSRSHCRIEPEAGGYCLIDTSRNGTLVDGEPVERALLADGCVVTVGPVAFTFTSRDEPGSAAGATGVTFVDHAGSDHGLRSFRPEQLEPGASGGAADAERQLGVLYRVSQLIHGIEAGDELLETLADLLRDCLEPERLFVVRRQGNELAVAAQRVRDGGAEARLSRTILERCTEAGERVLCPDAMVDRDLRAGSSVSEQQIRSVMAVPLESQKEILGALYLDSRQATGAFGESDLELLSAIGRQAGIALERASLIDDLEHLATGSILTLVAAVEAKDAYTRGHSERVAGYSVQVARRLGIGSRTVELIRLGALLHDVGKIGVPDAVLKKPGALTAAEMDEIRRHPGIGERIVRHIDHPRLELAQQIARWHHERPDGKGYPDGLTADGIPQPARIVAAADAFDAMNSPRPYRRALDAARIRDALERNQGTQFDAEAAQALLALWDGGHLERPDTVEIDLGLGEA